MFSPLLSLSTALPSPITDVVIRDYIAQIKVRPKHQWVIITVFDTQNGVKNKSEYQLTLCLRRLTRHKN